MKLLKIAFASLSILALTACGGGNSNPPNVRTVDMTRLGITNPTATGRVTIERLATGGLRTTVTVQSLTPNTQYAVHYHSLGTASTDPCLSNGPVSTALTNITTDASGNGSTQLTSTTNTVSDLGVYVNVHLSTDMTNVPLCGNVTGVGF